MRPSSMSTEEESGCSLKEYQQREIFAYGNYINCQILNWESGDPPRYLVCNPLHRDHREPFLAIQALGTWMRVDLSEALRGIDALMLAVVDATWGKALEDTSVPSTKIARTIIKDARASMSDLQRAVTV